MMDYCSWTAESTWRNYVGRKLLRRRWWISVSEQLIQDGGLVVDERMKKIVDSCW